MDVYGVFYVKELDKNLSGKSGEREVKICKNRFFILHPSFFILRKIRFDRAKGYVSSHER